MSLFEEPIGQYLARTGAQGKSAVLVPRIQIVTDVTDVPVSLDELKLFLRIDGNSEDTALTGLLYSATSQAEAWTGRALMPRTLKAWFDSPPYDLPLSLPYAPVRSVTEVTWYGDDDAENVLAATVYYADIYGAPARLALRNGQTWPTSLRSANGFGVKYECGYVNAGAVPNGIKEAIKLLCAHYYEGKDAQKLSSGDSTISGAPWAVRECLRPFVIPDFGD